MSDTRYKVQIRGTQPVLMHNNQACNPLNPFAKAAKAITKKRTKTDEDHETLAKIDWEAGLYISDAIGPYFPAVNIEAMLRDAAKQLRKGKSVTQSLRVFPIEIPLKYTGPRDIEGLKKIAFSGVKVDGEDFFDLRQAKIQKSTVMRARPRFNNWSMEFEIETDDEVFNHDDVVAIVQIAGTKIGVGDYRPRYGGFEILKLEVISGKK